MKLGRKMMYVGVLAVSLILPSTVSAHERGHGYYYRGGGVQEDLAAIHRNQHLLNYAGETEATRIRKDTKRRVQRLRDYGIEVSDDGGYYRRY